MASRPRRSTRPSRGWIRGLVLVGLLVVGIWTWVRVWNLQPSQPAQPSAMPQAVKPPIHTPRQPNIKPQPTRPKVGPEPIPLSPLPAVPEPKPNASSIPPQMAGTIFRHLSAGATEHKYIALTFDDGPWPEHTEQVLDLLQQYAVPATFFWLGESVQKFPQIAQKVALAGHAIGNHTWSHVTHTLSPEEAQAEIERTAELIRQTTGVQTQMFRPPGGHKENGLNTWARQNGYAVVMWSVQTDDWKAVSVQEIVDRALNNAQPGTVMLLHDGGSDRSKTVAALPQVIEGLKAQGYEFVTVPELLRVEAEKR